LNVIFSFQSGTLLDQNQQLLLFSCDDRDLQGFLIFMDLLSKFSKPEFDKHQYKVVYKQRAQCVKVYHELFRYIQKGGATPELLTNTNTEDLAQFVGEFDTPEKQKVSSNEFLTSSSST